MGRESGAAVTLDGLSPTWIDGPGELHRFGLGLCWLCHVCRKHYQTVWFRYPLDQEPQLDSGDLPLYERDMSKSGLADVTIYGRIESPCFTGYLINGELVQD